MLTKLMYALWDPEPMALHASALHLALSAFGAVRLQVNVDDEHVTSAMRIPTTSTPVGAVVSVWLPSQGQVRSDDITGVLREASRRLAGWQVEERRPIDPPETWDGTRVDGLANIAVLRRPVELDVEEWRHRWLVDHTPVAIETQGTFGYLQNVVVSEVTEVPDGFAPVAALVEELFPTAGITDVHAFFGSGGDDAELQDRMTRLMASVARFGADRDIDLVPTSRYLYDLAGTVDRSPA